MKLPQHEVAQLCKDHLKFDVNEIQALTRSASLEEANRKLDDLRKRIKKEFKHRALELHPDRTNNDKEKSELFSKLSALVQELDDLKLTAQPRPVFIPMQMNVRVYYGGGQTGTSTTGSTVTGFGNGFTVIF